MPSRCAYEGRCRRRGTSLFYGRVDEDGIRSYSSTKQVVRTRRNARNGLLLRDGHRPRIGQVRLGFRI
jgi:hypothetical protein